MVNAGCRSSDADEKALTMKLCYQAEFSNSENRKFADDYANMIGNRVLEQHWNPKVVFIDSVFKHFREIFDTAFAQLKQVRNQVLKISALDSIRERDFYSSGRNKELGKYMKQQEELFANRIAGLQQQVLNSSEGAEKDLKNKRAFRKERDSVLLTAAGLTPASAWTLISLWESRVFEIQILFLRYMLDIMPIRYSTHIVSQCLVAQNSTRLRPGEKLEITAGVGSFITPAQATMIIKGKIIKAGASGLIEYQLNTPPKPGSYSLPLIINYINDDGVPVSHEYKISYEIVGF